MYRALTLKAIEEGIDIKDTARLIQMAKASRLDLMNNPDGSMKVILDDKDVSLSIREGRITRLVSDLAKIKEIREVMLGLQRKLGRQRDSVLDGRDIGTVVFPNADKKFYIDAEFKERVARRYKELKGLGQDVTPEAIEADLKNRDTIDSTREFAPLKKADDAIYINTTYLTIEEVVEKVINYINLNG